MSMILDECREAVFDYFQDTKGLSAVQKVIYVTLTVEMQKKGMPLEEDYKIISLMCGASKYAVRNGLNTLFKRKKIIRTECGLWNPRLGEEMETVK